MLQKAEELFISMQKRYTPDAASNNVFIDILMDSWYDLKRSRAREIRGASLLGKANEIFLQAWEIGALNAPRRVFYDARRGSTIQYDLHRFGKWSVQFAVLRSLGDVCSLQELAMNRRDGRLLAHHWTREYRRHDQVHQGSKDVIKDQVGLRTILFVTGRGIRSGWSPVREVVIQQLRAMGFSVKLDENNKGTVAISGYQVHQMADQQSKSEAREPYDVHDWHHSLVNPRDVGPGHVTPKPTSSTKI